MSELLAVLKKPSWKIRRRIIIGTLFFCALVVAALTAATIFAGLDTALAGTIALGVLGLMASTIGSYVFGAAWDDKNHREYEEPPQRSYWRNRREARDCPDTGQVSDVPEDYAG